MQPIRLDYGLASIKGDLYDHYRHRVFVQQIHTKQAIDKTIGLYIIAKGMGSKDDATLAPKLIVKHIASFISTCLFDEMLTKGHDTPHYLEWIEEAIVLANNKVFQHPSKTLGGTAIVLLNTANKAYIGHVGDMMSILVESVKMKRITEFHTFGELLVKRGHITYEELAETPDSGRLYRAIGMDKTIEPELLAIEINESTGILLASNTAIDFINPNKFDLEAHQSLLVSKNPSDACKQLTDRSAQGWKSRLNTSAIFISNRFPFQGSD